MTDTNRRYFLYIGSAPAEKLLLVTDGEGKFINSWGVATNLKMSKYYKEVSHTRFVALRMGGYDVRKSKELWGADD